MIEKIDIKDASIIEIIRYNMQVATTDKKGLMGIDDRKYLKTITISGNTTGNASLGRICGLFRFVLWSDTNVPSLYLIDAIGKTVEFIAGYNVNMSNCEFRVASNENLVLNYNGTGTKTIHIRGLAEEIR